MLRRTQITIQPKKSQYEQLRSGSASTSLSSQLPISPPSLQGEGSSARPIVGRRTLTKTRHEDGDLMAIIQAQVVQDGLRREEERLQREEDRRIRLDSQESEEKRHQRMMEMMMMMICRNAGGGGGNENGTGSSSNN